MSVRGLAPQCRCGHGAWVSRPGRRACRLLTVWGVTSSASRVHCLCGAPGRVGGAPRRGGAVRRTGRERSDVNRRARSLSSRHPWRLAPPP